MQENAVKSECDVECVGERELEESVCVILSKYLERVQLRTVDEE